MRGLGPLEWLDYVGVSDTELPKRYSESAGMGIVR